MSTSKKTKLALMTIIALGTSVQIASAKMLEGTINQSSHITRLTRSNQLDSGATINAAPPLAPPLVRLNRGTPLVDNSKFASTPLRGNVDQGGLGGLASGNRFDIGADRNSRELTLAWEQWHKQLSKAIYDTWSASVDQRGRATLRVNVDKGRQITINILSSSGGPRFTQSLNAAIESLEGNAGLTFPSGSQRQVVSFEADYIADTDVQPGYSWVKGDYEKVQQGY